MSYNRGRSTDRDDSVRLRKRKGDSGSRTRDRS